MHRIILIAAAGVLYGATAVAQAPDDRAGGATGHGRGSTGPTFPVSGPDTLIATAPVPVPAPAPAGANIGLGGQAMPDSLGVDPDNSGVVPSPVGAPGPIR